MSARPFVEPYRPIPPNKRPTARQLPNAFDGKPGWVRDWQYGRIMNLPAKGGMYANHKQAAMASMCQCHTGHCPIHGVQPRYGKTPQEVLAISQRTQHQAVLSGSAESYGIAPPDTKSARQRYINFKKQIESAKQAIPAGSAMPPELAAQEKLIPFMEEVLRVSELYAKERPDCFFDGQGNDLTDIRPGCGVVWLALFEDLSDVQEEMKSNLTPDMYQSGRADLDRQLAALKKYIAQHEKGQTFARLRNKDKGSSLVKVAAGIGIGYLALKIFKVI